MMMASRQLRNGQGHLDDKPKIDPMLLAVMVAIAFAALIALSIVLM
jgi:hypothetical protein